MFSPFIFYSTEKLPLRWACSRSTPRFQSVCRTWRRASSWTVSHRTRTTEPLLQGCWRTSSSSRRPRRRSRLSRKQNLKTSSVLVKLLVSLFFTFCLICFLCQLRYLRGRCLLLKNSNHNPAVVLQLTIIAASQCPSPSWWRTPTRTRIPSTSPALWTWGGPRPSKELKKSLRVRLPTASWCESHRTTELSFCQGLRGCYVSGRPHWGFSASCVTGNRSCAAQINNHLHKCTNYLELFISVS